MLYSLFVAQIVDEQFLSILTFIYLVIKYHDKTTIYIYIYIYAILTFIKKNILTICSYRFIQSITQDCKTKL